MCFYILHMHGLLDVIQIWIRSKSRYPRLSLKPASECAEFQTSGEIQEENFNCQPKNKKSVFVSAMIPTMPHLCCCLQCRGGDAERLPPAVVPAV